MPFIVPQDVEELVANHVASGGYRSGDEVLRSAMHALAELEEDLVAVQRAVVDWRSGDEGVTLVDAFKQIRSVHHPGTGE